jgi:hypothetical protein
LLAAFTTWIRFDDAANLDMFAAPARLGSDRLILAETFRSFVSRCGGWLKSLGREATLYLLDTFHPAGRSARSLALSRRTTGL